MEIETEKEQRFMKNKRTYECRNGNVDMVVLSTI